VTAINKDVREQGVWDSVCHCDWLLEATDSDEARHFIQRKCAEHGISLISVGSGFLLRDGVMVSAGSRANRVQAGVDGCLECQVLDEEPMEQSHVSYAVPNMIAASLAVDMLIREIVWPGADAENNSNIESRSANLVPRDKNYVSFDLLERRLLTEKIVPDPGCPVCGLWGSVGPR